MTPQFSISSPSHGTWLPFRVAEHSRRSEFGVEWHNAAKRRNVRPLTTIFPLRGPNGSSIRDATSPGKLAIFGGSTRAYSWGQLSRQRPDPFPRVVCMVPMLDSAPLSPPSTIAHVCAIEFGTADDPDDFPVLAKYSRIIRSGTAWPIPR